MPAMTALKSLSLASQLLQVECVAGRDAECPWLHSHGGRGNERPQPTRHCPAPDRSPSALASLVGAGLPAMTALKSLSLAGQRLQVGYVVGRDAECPWLHSHGGRGNEGPQPTKGIALHADRSRSALASLVGAGLPAMAALKSLSLASQRLQVGYVVGRDAECPWLHSHGGRGNEEGRVAQGR